MKACRDDEKIKPVNPLIIANTLWAVVHGTASLLIDGQIPPENAFHGLPALLQEEKDPGTPDVRQIFEAMSQVLFSGLLLE